MSGIDWERLIVRQTYFIPVKASQLKTAINKELEAYRPSILGIRAWILVDELKNSLGYEYSLEYATVRHATLGIKRGTKKFAMVVEEKATEYNRGLPRTFYDKLAKALHGMPMKLYVFVTNTEKRGCRCDVECFPMLYQKLIMKVKKEADEFDTQDAYLTCRRFLKSIFEGGLSATLISEEKKELLKPTTQLLINDQASHQILDKIKKMLDQATGEVLLCGWIGTLLLPKLKEIKQKGVNIRVISHKEAELKGKPGHRDVQTAFKELISMVSKDNISIRPECHCRVVIVDNKALIGSMDLNAISLTGSHRELAIYTEDPEIARNLRKYFNEIFSPLSKEKAK